MRILHLIPSISARYGGPGEALAGWCDGLVGLGVSVTVAGLSSPGEGPSITLDYRVERVEATRQIPYIQYSSGLASLLQRETFDLVHSHGLWTYVNYLADKLAWERRVPHIISCCGMLDPKALARSAGRKRIAAQLFQRKALEHAARLIANSEHEACDIARFASHDRVSIVPNPVRARPLAPAKGRRSPLELVAELPADARVLLFIGRLHPVKGLERLLMAWSAVQNKFPNWHLILAGPDQGGYRQTIVSYSKELQSRIHLPGQVDGHEKWALLDRADLFVMPSDHENFGIAIAEALTAGVPVITTHGTPWRDLPRNGAGWWVPADVSSIGAALDEAMGETRSVRDERSRRSKAIAMQFSVDRVSRDLLTLYENSLAHETAGRQ